MYKIKEQKSKQSYKNCFAEPLIKKKKLPLEGLEPWASE